MNSKIFTYNRLGLFPLPEDDEESYLKRGFAPQGGEDIPSAILKELYDINPTYVPIVYSNKQLTAWEAGCSWMEGDRVWIQLRESFQRKKKLFGMYAKDEVLAHELVHAVRYPLGSDRYEEFFAYYTSTCFGYRFRAFLGPIFTRPIESKIFLGSLLIPYLGIFFDISEFFFVPLLIVSFFFVRLLKRWYTWFECKKKIGLPLMIRLTDEEIESIHKKKGGEVGTWLEEQQKNSFRWQLLYNHYCKES